MKKMLLIAGLLLSLNSFAQRSANKIAAGALKLETPADSLQYTLGAYMGQWIISNGFTIANPDLFKRGMDDVLLNRNLAVDAGTVAGRLDAYQKRLISERSTQQEKLLFENIKGKEGVGMLPSGVAYVVMKAGNGFRPQVTDSVLIHVKGFLPDGKQFEDTYAKGIPLRGTPATFIAGLNEALQIMPRGSIWRIFVPSDLGYAEQGVPGVVPPYSALIFEVELMQVARNR